MKTYKNLTNVFVLLVLCTGTAHAQVCAIPANDGDNLTVNGTVNTYWSVPNNTYDTTSSSIPLQNRRGNAVNIVGGDLVLVIQMQCADIDFSDTDSYGDGVAGDTQFGSPVASGYSDPAASCLAGQYEYVRAGIASSSTSLDLSDNPLTNTYIQAAATASTGRRTVQVIRVPQYNNATISATVTSVVWDGFSGGIVVLDVARTLDFNGNDINVDGAGFRGGGGRERSVNDPNTRYRWDTDDRHAIKGEGIAGTPRFVSEKRDPNTAATAAITDLGAAWGGYPDGTANNGDFARGAPGNAGGGGTFWNGSSDNGGGGAGGNGGAGGRGGAGWRSAGYAGILADYSNLPEKKWGFGGSAFSAASISRVVLGGGGAAGDNNLNSTPQESSGAAGAGIVMIRARSILGTGTISARGARAADNSLNDGAGAGGAGGSVLIIASDMSTATITVNANGGKGADTWLTGSSAHGTGGGGGGGVVFRTGAATVDVSGGINGTTTINDSPSDGADHGAKPGDIGINTLITVAGDTPGINTGFRCLDFGDAPSSYGLADHNLGNTVSNLFLGTIQADGNPDTIANIPSANSDADDNNDTDDEDGLTLPTSSASDGTYSVTTTVFNNTGIAANLCGWVDFDQDGIFQSDESVCTVVSSMATSQSVDLIFTVAVSDRGNTGTINARFRLTTDALTINDPTGSASDGEVEDFTTTVTTLPVSINGFESKKLSDGLLVKWNTASETRNIGFYLWGSNGDDNAGFVRLSKQLIPTKSMGALDPQQYEIKLPSKYKNYTNLAISAVDTQGEEELFGLYDTGSIYGRENLPSAIDWQDINHKMLNSFKSVKGTVSFSKSQINTLKAQLKTNQYGMHRISYEELLNAGFDLFGTNIETIAVTLNNQAIARRIGSTPTTNGNIIYSDSFEPYNSSPTESGFGLDSYTNSGEFGPGMFIDFWVSPPAFPDAEYINNYTYEISTNKNLVLPIELRRLSSSDTTSSYQKKITINENNQYSFTNSSPDAWYAKMLRDYASEQDKIYQVTFDVGTDLITGIDGQLNLKLIGGSDLPINPDHQVKILFNGNELVTHDFDGLNAIELNLSLPSEFIRIGSNTAEVRLTSGTQASFDLVLVDEVQLSYTKKATLTNGFLQLERQLINSDFTVNDTNSANLIAYSLGQDKQLKLLEYTLLPENSAKFAHNSSQANYWISTPDQLHQVSNINTIQSNDLLAGAAEYLIIAHQAFMPDNSSQDHALNRYIQHRQAQGWQTKLVSINDIQAQYGGGMALPGALTSYLRTADSAFDYSHVLLIGSDSYDYMDRLDLQSISFIPTQYAVTSYIPHTPSDQLLFDLDSDGISDKAFGRWPVRSMANLDSIVDKTIQWDNISNTNAVFVTDTEDGNSSAFKNQSQRLIDLFDADNWNQGITQIYTDQMDTSNGASAATQVRQQLFELWENSKTLTSFIGHGSPTQWSRSGILNADDVDDVFNNGTPTLIGTLTCYTSYFVSPRTNTLAHQLLNGSAGNANGAVAVHGAASLSAYSSNELFAKEVLNQQLSGKTLGEAVQQARLQARANGYNDQVINWTLLGDPTIVINPN